MEADDDTRSWGGGYLISPAAPGVRSEEIQLNDELVSILCHRSRRRLRDLQYACKVTMRLDRTRQTLSLTGSDAGIQMAKQQIEGLSGPRRTVPLKVWVELMRTRTLALDDLSEPKTVSVAWVQERSGCRLHIERGSCEVRIFGSQSGAAIASKIIDDMEPLCSEEMIHVRGDPSIMSSPSLQSIAHACNATFRVQGLGIAVLGLEANVAKAVAQLERFLEDPQGYSLPEDGKQEVRPLSSSKAASKMVESEPKRCENVCPTCHSGPFCSNCGQLVWRPGYAPNQAPCVSPAAMQYQFVVMQPMEAGNMNCMMPNMQSMQPMQSMQSMQPMQSAMVPMCMPGMQMAVAMPQQDLAMGG